MRYYSDFREINYLNKNKSSASLGIERKKFVDREATIIRWH